jgi:hypothetical protein
VDNYNGYGRGGGDQNIHGVIWVAKQYDRGDGSTILTEEIINERISSDGHIDF